MSASNNCPSTKCAVSTNNDNEQSKVCTAAPAQESAAAKRPAATTVQQSTILGNGKRRRSTGNFKSILKKEGSVTNLMGVKRASFCEASFKTKPFINSRSESDLYRRSSSPHGPHKKQRLNEKQKKDENAISWMNLYGEPTASVPMFKINIASVSSETDLFSFGKKEHTKMESAPSPRLSAISEGFESMDTTESKDDTNLKLSSTTKSGEASPETKSGQSTSERGATR